MMDSRTIRILAVDDDKAARFLYESIGARSNWHVIAAETCEDALALIRTVKFDVILMDWKLPEMSGLDCTRIIRKEEAEMMSARTPIIGITANAMRGHREECLDAGMDDYLSKPFKAQDLLDMVDRWTKIASDEVPSA